VADIRAGPEAVNEDDERILVAGGDVIQPFVLEEVRRSTRNRRPPERFGNNVYDT